MGSDTFYEMPANRIFKESLKFNQNMTIKANQNMDMLNKYFRKQEPYIKHST